MNVLTETLNLTGKGSSHGYDYETGTVKVEFGRKVITVECRVYNNSISLFGFVGRYRTSMNPWLASVHCNLDGSKVYAYFGRDDRSGRFNKLQGISYEPETYAAELAKVRKENETRRSEPKTKTVAATSATKYEYPAGLTAKQKQAFRAKARRAKA